MRTRLRSPLAWSVLAATFCVWGVTAQPRPWLDDVTADVGLAFTHVNGATGEFHLPEIMGAGVALLDYDNDGDLDVFLVQSGEIGGTKEQRSEGTKETRDEGTKEPRNEGTKDGRKELRHRLFRNDLTTGADGTRRLRLTDVTDEAGFGPVRGYGMGVATGDVDGDGFVDLYVTAFGDNTLYRNKGDGTFEDITARAGVQESRWSSSAAFVDIDRDGHLDLFVANYLEFSVQANRPCTEPAGARDYCAPSVYRPVPDRLFRNKGDGTFEDVSERAGILRAFGAGLGVAIGDYDRDGHPDIYVANDATPNQLWRNRGDGTFDDDGLLSGTAFNAAGRPEGSMGIASGDYDADGDEDIVVTNLVAETFVLYENDGQGGFEDRRVAVGLSQPTAMMTGFGTEWVDLDNDGVFDILFANGAVNLVPALRGSDNPFRQRNQVLRGSRIGERGSGIADRGSRIADRGSGIGDRGSRIGDRRQAGVQFEELTGAAAGPAFDRLDVSRGLAIGDLDNDGFADVVISTNGSSARVLRNTAATGHGWIGFVLEQPGPNRTAIGASLVVESGPARGTTFRVRTDGSYLSASDPRVLVGLGAWEAPVTVTVTWPDGTVQRVADLAPGRYHTLRRQ